MSSFVLESLFPILQITGVKIALVHAFIPGGDAKLFHKLSQTTYKRRSSHTHTVHSSVFQLEFFNLSV